MRLIIKTGHLKQRYPTISKVTKHIFAQMINPEQKRNRIPGKDLHEALSERILDVWLGSVYTF